jgi:hypothetical protein
MSLLTMLQGVATRIGLTRPLAIVSSLQDEVLQLLDIANEEGQELAARYSWQALTTESTFLTVAAESQGTLTTIAGADFNFISNETFWNRDQRRPVFGPLSDSKWQQLKAQQVVGPWVQFRIRGDEILFIPEPAAGQTCAFEWVSKNWCVDAAGTPTYSSWNDDDNTGRLDERVMALGVIWRWKEIKGFEYAEDFNKYERAVTDYMTRDGGKPRLSLGDSQFDVYPGVIVPSGNWGVP